MTWSLRKQNVDKKELLVQESLFAIANGYIGVRGNFEEGLGTENASIRGTYINAFHDETEIQYGEKLHGFPETQQKILNVIDAQSIDLSLDGEQFSLFEGKIIAFERNLFFDKGFSERMIHWKSPKGQEVKITIRRLTSFITKELFAIEYYIEPITPIHHAIIVSTVNGDVSNFVDRNDPRVASGHAKRLKVMEVKYSDKYSIVANRTYNTKLDVACVTSTSLDSSHEIDIKTDKEGLVQETYTCSMNSPIRFLKKNVYTDSLRHEIELIKQGIAIQESIRDRTFAEFVEDQTQYLQSFWKRADIVISGDDQLQEGIRFNLFQLLQSVGKDQISNIAAKGLSGEGYEGHYFWDTEIYMFPVFLLTEPSIAKNLLLQRYSLLNSAKERAREVGHAKGALFPWRTITGKESSAFFPAGTAQYHISADIAYSFIQYYLVTNDEEFLANYLAEVLFETARLWVDTGHFLDGKFRIDDVTGPDEYTCIVNNNYYTNSMAKHNLLWAAKVYHLLKEADESKCFQLSEKIGLSDNEVEEWELAGQLMYLPYNKKYKINEQDDTFLQKKVWNLEKTAKEDFPLLLHYHPLTLYRYQVCKQADTVLSHFLLEDEQDLETIKHSYDYYEKVTTHDSSLSYCVFSIMASKLGYEEKAYNYFNETARLDLDNTHGNTKDGLHMANMGGTWLAIVFGFAGVRIKETGLSFHPSLPKKWDHIVFHIQYQKRTIRVKISHQDVKYQLIEGDAIMFMHKSSKITLKDDDVVISMQEGEKSSESND